jgi:hypothetical protein
VFRPTRIYKKLFAIPQSFSSSLLSEDEDEDEGEGEGEDEEEDEEEEEGKGLWGFGRLFCLDEEEVKADEGYEAGRREGMEWR